ncbi:tyrosine-type recombinase/integrase [uncultured Jannaschia sp.]|uniref:tyrosine-type recombinase/integrase n=1 Tax=uncultured Jannaschia sp. TaxID=293347 RepID=UPI00262587C7|nr:tyrosine-type recombinase/integrase [uncultured Jannaschia sp.]
MDIYLPGPWGSDEFRTGYHAAEDAAEKGVAAPAPLRAEAGTIGHAIESYLASEAFAKTRAKGGLADSTKRGKRLRLDRIRGNYAEAKLASIEAGHVERMMARYDGPAAANRFKKDIAQIFDWAAKHHGFKGPNPARLAKSQRMRKGGHHSWTDDEIEAFRDKHPSGTKARLALELLLNTGAARVDAVKLGPRNIRAGLIVYERQKTEDQAEDVIEVPIPILPELANELALAGTKAMTFLNHGTVGKPYLPETFGNLFRDWCVQAGVPGRAHGLRKAGARMLAEADGTEMEVAAILGHANTREASRYCAAAKRTKLAASGMRKRALAAIPSPNRKAGLGDQPPEK